MRKLLYLVPYAHLDTQWRWEYPTTIAIYLRNTLDRNLALFDQYPGHRFNFTGALRYAMMKEYYPEQFGRVKELIAQGRWHLAGTCLDETDALVPSAESMIRNILYGHRWQIREFGSSSQDYMLPDCFGFPANLPTVMAHCGIHGFSSNKLTWKSATGIPFEIGIWAGPDGSEIVSALRPCRYDSALRVPPHLSPGRRARLRRMGTKTGVWASFQYYGVGDIGGAPTRGSVRQALKSIRRSAGRGRGLEVRQGSADEFFAGLTVDQIEHMDRHQGELLLVNHSAGSLTSAAIMKRWNRKNEQLAFAAEAAAVIAQQIAGLPYPSDRIGDAWQRVIASQMHDILPGTSTPTAYEFAQNDEVIALKIWSRILLDSAEAIAPHVPGEGDLLLYNPLVQSRSDAAKIHLSDWSGGSTGTARAADGRCYPAQIRPDESGGHTAVFTPELPPLGWARFSLAPDETAEPGKAGGVTLRREADFRVLENGYYRVTVFDDGVISSVFDVQSESELLARPLAYELQAERPMTFPAWNMYWRDRRNAPAHRIEGRGRVEVIEDGAERCSLGIRVEFKSSVFVKEISLTRGSRLVEFTERISWRESGYSLKLALHTRMQNPDVTFNWETSRTSRGVNHKRCFEMPSRLWVDMTEGDSGISIIENSKYGWDRPSPSTVRMTLLYTPAVRPLGGFKDQATQDWGSHTIRYAIYSHPGDWKDTDVISRQFNQPVRAFQVARPAANPGPVPPLFTVSSEQAGVMAIKKPEDAKGMLIRLYERHGSECSVDLTFPRAVRSVSQANGLEQPIQSITASGHGFTARLQANGMAAYLVQLADSAPDSVPDFSHVDLAFNARMIGQNGETGSALLPAELTPREIRSGAIAFRLGGADGPNAVASAAQEIALPPGFGQLSLLWGAGEKCRATFTWLAVDGTVLGEQRLTAPSMTEHLGQWDTRTWRREPRHTQHQRRDYVWRNRCTGITPGRVNRDRLEWFSTHTHIEGKDQPYRFGYLFSKRLDIPARAHSIRLPSDSRVLILAMTLSNDPVQARSCDVLIDQFDF